MVKRSGSSGSTPNNNEHIAIQENNLPRQVKKDNDGSDSSDSTGGIARVKKWWKFRMRGFDDDGERDWWFASTAIPLLAATIAPLANVLSIAALVTYWRMDIDNGQGQPGPQFKGVTYRDPRWCYWLNLVSLICGFVGNVFLLFNFTGRIRYILALPATILLWYVATGILIAITVCMHIYVPPVGPLQVYSQGYWYAVIAAILYCACSMLLMVNMLGYFMGHYPQTFELSDHQRTLILQTMLFFIWLAGGGAVFSTVESRYSNDPIAWSFVDGVSMLVLLFCQAWYTDVNNLSYTSAMLQSLPLDLET
jgi:potassium channel subfamily K